MIDILKLIAPVEDDADDLVGLNDEVLDILVKHAALMKEFEGMHSDLLRRKLNHLSTPLAFWVANQRRRMRG